MRTAYLAPVGLEEALEQELGSVDARYDRLFVQEGPPRKAYWAQNIWRDVELIEFRSLSDAAKKLRERGSLWAFYPYQEIRKGALISEQLGYFSPKPLQCFAKLPTAPLGSWTLLNSHQMLVAARCSSPLAHGEFHFAENKTPPSRAYLKLWELFTRTGRWPKKGERCLELGASPGSWSWVLNELGAEVTAVDRAPLEISLPRVDFLQQDAFLIKPDPQISWVFSDLACYPEKLLGWIRHWFDEGLWPNFVCTLKFQGNDGYGIVREFEKIAGSEILHLFHNKHELSWVLLAKQTPDRAE